MIAQLYRLGAQTIRIRGILEQRGILHADMVSLVVPEDDAAARPLMAFLAQEALRDDGCTMEPDDEPYSFLLSWR